MDSTPDLQILVRDKRPSNDVVQLSFKVKARNVGLGLNFVEVGSKRVLERPDRYLGQVFDEISEIEMLVHEPGLAEDRLASLGHDLAKACLCREMIKLFADLEGSVSSVQIHSDESWIPWELIKPGASASFLGEAFAISRWFHGQEEHLFLPVESMALVVPPDSRLPKASREQAELQALENESRTIDLLVPEKRLLLHALTSGDYDALHFCGHCSEPVSPIRWSLDLGGRQWLTPSDVLTMSRPEGRPGFVYFNACHSAGTVLTAGGLDGWARSLAQAGTGAFLGSLWAVGDDASFALARAFYRGFLRESLPIAEAARRARLETRRLHPGDPGWLSLAVFAHPLALARRPTVADPAQARAALIAAERFALLRALELDAFAPGDRVTVIQPDEPTDPERAVVVFDGERIHEVWATYPSSRHEDLILPTLSALDSRYGHGPNTDVGLMLGTELDEGVERWATLFELGRVRRDLDPETRRALMKSVAQALTQVEGSFLWQEEDEDEEHVWTRLGRYSIRGLPEQEVQRRVLTRLAERLRLESPIEGSLQERFDAATGAALGRLHRRSNHSTSTRSLLEAMERATRGHRAAEPSREEQEQAIRALLENNRGLLDQGVQGRSIGLGDLWVAPMAQFRSRDDDRISSSVEAETWLRDELETGRSFTIVLGDFGHGKTTLLRYLTATLSETWRPNDPIPVLLVLRDLRHPNSDVSEMVADALRPHLRLTDALWRRHRWLLFCDGFDEMSLAFQHREDWVSLCFSNFVRESKLHNVQVVVSSRPILFLDPVRRRETVERFDRLTLLPFDDGQIESWLEHWSHHETPISIASLEERDLLNVARTPVLLTMIALIFHQSLSDITQVRNRADVYRRFFDWTAAWGGLPEPGDGPKQRVPEGYREILQEIAWLMFSHPSAESGLIAYEVLAAELEATLYGAIAPSNDDDRSRERALELEVDERIFVAHAFRERRKRHLEFIHQSLREYLVAEKSLRVFRGIGLGETYHWSIQVVELQSSRPLTQAKLEFFRELIETLDDREKTLLAERAQNLWYWPSLLYALLDQVPEKLAESRHYPLIDGRLAVEKTQGLSPAIVLGNLCLLAFVFEAVLNQSLGIDDDQLPDRLKGLLQLLESDPGCTLLVEVLQQTLVRMSFRNVVFHRIDFSRFRLEHNEFSGCRFVSCRFEETSFRGSRLTASESGATVFEGCEISAPRRFDVELDGVEFLNCRVKSIQAQSGTVSRNATWRRCHFEECGIAHFYRRATYEACTFEATRPLPDVLPIPEAVEARFIACLAIDPESEDDSRWRPVHDPRDLVLSAIDEADESGSV